MQSWSRYRLAAVALTALAAVLLIVDISLGVHYKNLRDTHLSIDDTDRLSVELIELQQTYKAAVETISSYQAKLQNELSHQTETNWEFDHQTRRNTNFKEQLAEIKDDVASLNYQLPMIMDGCRLCPTGWILMNSVCYYFALSDDVRPKTWTEAQDFCRLYGGGLAMIDSKDKENSTVNFLRNNANKDTSAFWIGAKRFSDDVQWKWVDETNMAEGYWLDTEPTISSDADNCAGILPKENFFKAWVSQRCMSPKRWICEKAPSSVR